MANRRMFSNQIINSARFLQMPSTTRLLYYDLGMKADDDGFVEAFSVLRMTGASEDDLRLLQAKGYINIINDDMTAYIYDWAINNQIRKDRYQESIYHYLLPQMERAETKQKPGVTQSETNRKPIDNQLTTNGCRSIVKDSIDKDSKGKYSTECDVKPFPGVQTAQTNRYIPTLEEVIEYAESRGRVDLAEQFFDYYNEADWYDSTGARVRGWKQKFISWELRNPKTKKKNDIPDPTDWEGYTL